MVESEGTRYPTVHSAKTGYCDQARKHYRANVSEKFSAKVKGNRITSLYCRLSVQVSAFIRAAGKKHIAYLSQYCKVGDVCCHK